MGDIVFRKALKSDTSEILYFVNELAKFEKLENQVNTSEEELIKNIFDEQYAEVLFVEVDGKNVGFCLYFYTFSTFEGKPTLYLEDLFILETERHKGFGKKTLEFLANKAIKKGCARFEWSCLNWNKDAIDFYIKFGALPKDEWTLFRLEGSSLIGYKK